MRYKKQTFIYGVNCTILSRMTSKAYLNLYRYNAEVLTQLSQNVEKYSTYEYTQREGS